MFCGSICGYYWEVYIEEDVPSGLTLRFRGDVMPISIGKETNIQDNCVLHGTSIRLRTCKIGNRVTVGHSVVLHGCEIGDHCLIGMGSIIMTMLK